MKWSEMLDKWSLNQLSVNAGFLKLEFAPNEKDKKCAWYLYIELLTRITTQPLEDDHGDESSALSSVFSLFKSTREILKSDGRHCKEFSKISIIVLNQIIRPFTAKWHKHSLNGELNSEGDLKRNDEVCIEFREELVKLQVELVKYTKLLADMADVEDLTEMEIF